MLSQRSLRERQRIDSWIDASRSVGAALDRTAPAVLLRETTILRPHRMMIGRMLGRDERNELIVIAGDDTVGLTIPAWAR